MKNTVIEALLNSPHADGDKLPSVRQLMQYLHTASGTVQSALRELANRGFIYTDPGKGCFWGKRKAVELPPLKPSAQNELSEKFFADVRSGYFSLQGALPSQKELALRYRDYAHAPILKRHSAKRNARTRGQESLLLPEAG